MTALPSVQPFAGQPFTGQPFTGQLAAIEQRTSRVVVIGQGYVGLPVALRAHVIGYPVVGFDLDQRRVEELLAGSSYVGDVSNESLQSALQGGYRPSCNPNDLSGFDIAVVSVPTPLREGAPDLSAIESAGRALAVHLRPGCCVILESTTYPGTTSELLGPILEAGSGLRAGTDFALGYSPERIDPGNTTWGFVETPKVVAGIDEASLDVVDAFFQSLVDRTVRVSTTAAAELTKLLENTFRHVNISLVNELAMFARDLGIDIWEVVDAASTKPFGFMRFTPGPGVGGHCLPVDPSYLSWRVRQHLGRPFRVVELANDINEHMPNYVFERITALLNQHRKPVAGSRVLLLGLAYKSGTSDWRESPTVPLAERLSVAMGDVRICDPNIAAVNTAQLQWPLVKFSAEELAAADVVVVMVDHPQFDADLIVNSAQLIFDTKHFIKQPFTNGEYL
jgi:UDP-N-acetyl-D-glucosamine dehydrogenase